MELEEDSVLITYIRSLFCSHTHIRTHTQSTRSSYWDFSNRTHPTGIHPTRIRNLLSGTKSGNFPLKVKVELFHCLDVNVFITLGVFVSLLRLYVSIESITMVVLGKKSVCRLRVLLYLCAKTLQIIYSVANHNTCV